MSRLLDMALDDYINTKKSYNRKGGPAWRGGRSQAVQIRSSPSIRTIRSRNAPYDRLRPPKGDINGQWSHDLFDDGRSRERIPRRSAATTYSNGSSKLLVENLFYEVTQDHLQNLFSKVGTVKKVFLHYDRAGRSLGVADVTFEDSEDAAAALRKYNGMSLEGQEMRIKYGKPAQKIPSGRATTPSDNGSVFDRLGGARGGSVKQTVRGNIRSRLGRGESADVSPSASGHGSSQTDSRRRMSQRKPVSYEDLDADLDAYMATEFSGVEKIVSKTTTNNENAMDLS